MKNNRWCSNALKRNIETEFDSRLDMDIVKILHSRGCDTKEKIDAFLNPSLDNIGNPMGLADMEKAAQRIEKAIKEGENIWIYGDYDADGVTSTALLYKALKRLGAKNLEYYIPLRKEGYGVNCEALKKIRERKGGLVITVDCGTTSFKEAEFAGSIGLEMIITDHHSLLGDKVPCACAVINPKRKENTSVYSMIAGAGTAFMLTLCLFRRAGIEKEAFDYIDLAGIGTIADVVPLFKENRIFARFGLEKIKNSKNKGLSALADKLFSKEDEITSTDIAFGLGPLINAAGRLDDAKVALRLLISDDGEEIDEISSRLVSLNSERKKLQDSIAGKISRKIDKEGTGDLYVIVDKGDYHHGVLGIAAAKVSEKYCRPAIVMGSNGDGTATGSCRSIEGFDMLEALQSMPEMFERFGGHSMAAGLTIKTERIAEFKKRINEYAKSKIPSYALTKTVKYDKIIPAHKISYDFVEKLRALEPFGAGNPLPVFRLNDVALDSIRAIGKNSNHMMFNIRSGSFTFENAVWFNCGNLEGRLSESERYDIVFEMKNETYLGKVKAKIFVKDMKKRVPKSQAKLLEYKSLYESVFPRKALVYYKKFFMDEIISRKGLMDIDEKAGKLYLGGKEAAVLEPNDAECLRKLSTSYGWKFYAKFYREHESVRGATEILICRKYEVSPENENIFLAIRKSMLGEMEYDVNTQKMLHSFFKDKKNLVLEKNYSIKNFLATCSLYFRSRGLKCQAVLKSGDVFLKNFLEQYFEVNGEYKKGFSFTAFIDTMPKKEAKERFCIVSNAKENFSCASRIKLSKLDKNIVLLDALSDYDKKRINLENIYFEFLPFEEKLRIKKIFEKGEKVYGDDSVFEIFS